MGFKILVVDDEKTVGTGISRHLAKEGYQTFWVRTGEEALEKIVQENFHLIFLDLNLPGIGGMPLLERIKQEFPEILVIIITAYGNVEMAVQAMKMGAFDYLTKSSDMEELKLLVKKALETKNLRKEIKSLRAEIDRHHGNINLVGNSPAIEKVRHLIKKVSGIDHSSILIIGESGTGKELVARNIHRQSERAEEPFIDISCSALPSSLMESELFGFEKGAFTDAKNKKLGLLELADGGALFLDEIGTLELSTQAKLLRFLEQRTFRRVGGVKDISVNINVMAAANTDLRKMLEEGTFRPDLYYRLNIFLIRVPPLRHRKEDIPLLIKCFINKFNHDFHKNIQGIDPLAQKVMMEYDYPGNVRELKNIIERAMIMEEENVITRNELDFFKNRGEDMPGNYPTPIGSLFREDFVSGENLSLKELEIRYIVKILKENGGNKVKAAKMLGIARSTLFNKIKEYRLNDYL